MFCFIVCFTLLSTRLYGLKTFFFFLLTRSKLYQFFGYTRTCFIYHAHLSRRIFEPRYVSDRTWNFVAREIKKKNGELSIYTSSHCVQFKGPLDFSFLGSTSLNQQMTMKNLGHFIDSYFSVPRFAG